MVDAYNWVGSLCPNPKHFEFSDCPNKVVDSKEKVEACKDVLFMFPVDSQVVPTGNSKLYEKDNSVYDVGDEEADRFFKSFRQPYGLEKDSIAVDASCKCNLKKIIQDEIELLQLKLKEPVKVLCHRHPDRFWKILFKQKIDFSVNDTSITWSGEAGADGGELYREFLLRPTENFYIALCFLGKKVKHFSIVPHKILWIKNIRCWVR